MCTTQLLVSAPALGMELGSSSTLQVVSGGVGLFPLALKSRDSLRQRLQSVSWSFLQVGGAAVDALVPWWGVHVGLIVWKLRLDKAIKLNWWLNLGIWLKGCSIF